MDRQFCDTDVALTGQKERFELTQTGWKTSYCYRSQLCIDFQWRGDDLMQSIAEENNLVEIKMNFSAAQVTIRLYIQFDKEIEYAR